MRISPVNYSMQRAYSAQIMTVNKKCTKPSETSYAPQSLSFGIDYDRIKKNLEPKFNFYDKNGVFTVEDISDKKVGKKYLLHPTDPKYKDLTILFTPKTTIDTPNHELEAYYRPSVCPVSFGGQVWGSIRSDKNGADNVMKKAYTDFWETGMRDLVHTTERSEGTDLLKDDYNFFIPSDGDGTRYRDITKLQGGVTKPASRIPAQLNGHDMRLVQGILANFAKTSKLGNAVGFVEVKPAQGSAYAFLEGLANGDIPTDKPIVFSWGDNFSDIDITKLMLEHEKNNSGFTMLTLPVDTERVKSLGAARVKSADNLEMTEFIEKPTDEETIQRFIVPETENQCLGVVGPYILSPAVLAWLKDNYANNPESFKDPSKGYDFSSKIIGQLIGPMSEGELVDEEGNALKMYAYEKPKEETWSDLGSEKDFSAEMKNVKHGKFDNLPKEMKDSISKNVDRYGNITFDQKTKHLLQEFLDEYEIDLRNAIVYSK